MADLPKQASVVVIGGGIVGNSMAYHLSRLGWTELVLIEKGALPNPGGSTGHASNFIFPVDHSKEMTTLTKDSARQYEELGSRGRETARADGGAEPPHLVRSFLGRGGVRAADTRAGGREGSLRQPGRYPRRLLHTRSLRRRPVARGDADARVRAGARRDRAREHGGDGNRHREHPCAQGPYRQGLGRR